MTYHDCQVLRADPVKNWVNEKGERERGGGGGAFKCSKGSRRAVTAVDKGEGEEILYKELRNT